VEHTNFPDSVMTPPDTASPRAPALITTASHACIPITHHTPKIPYCTPLYLGFCTSKLYQQTKSPHPSEKPNMTSKAPMELAQEKKILRVIPRQVPSCQLMMMHSERITPRCRQSSSDDQTHVTIGSEPRTSPRTKCGSSLPMAIRVRMR